MEIMHAPDLASVLNLSLSQHAYDELLDMQDLITFIGYEPDLSDRWSFIWGNDKYSSRKIYTLAFSSIPTPSTFS